MFFALFVGHLTDVKYYNFPERRGEFARKLVDRIDNHERGACEVSTLFPKQNRYFPNSGAGGGPIIEPVYSISDKLVAFLRSARY